MPGALLVDDLVEPVRDVLVHAAEVVAVELLAPLLAQLLEHLAHALHVAALAILETLLHHPAQRGVEIAVVEEIVGHLLEQRVGVEVEPDLGAVPAGVSGTVRHAVTVARWPRDEFGGPDFWWGTGASSTQAEGAAPGIRLVRARTGREDAAERRRQRLRANGSPRTSSSTREHGLTHHRLSIEWARIEPEEGRRDDAAIEHYLEVLTAAACRRACRPGCACTTSRFPGWFTEMGGGFVDDRARSYFWARHVAFCAETFGDLVFGWKPINEPGAYAGIYPHGQKRFDMLGAVLLAQRDAWRELRGGGKPVATIHNLSPVFTVADTVPADTMHGRHRRDDVGRVDARRSRRRAGAPRAGPPLEVPDLREACDIVGFSYYARRGSTPRAAIVPYPTDGARRADGIRAVERRARDRAAPAARRAPGPAAVDLRARRRHRRRRLALRRAAGVARRSSSARSTTVSTCAGFFHWTGVDNYEWDHGFDVQFGCFTRDREPRGSAELLAGRTPAADRRQPTSTPRLFRSSVTRSRISSRIGRTASTPCPAGSSSAQSSYRLPG